MSERTWSAEIHLKQWWATWLSNQNHASTLHTLRSTRSLKNVLIFFIQSVIIRRERSVQLQHWIGSDQEVHWSCLEAQNQQHKVEKGAEGELANQERRNHCRKWEDNWGEGEGTRGPQGGTYCRRSWDVFRGAMVSELRPGTSIVRGACRSCWGHWQWLLIVYWDIKYELN